MSFVSSLQKAFESMSRQEDALAMAKYMKNKFAFFGIKTTPRRAVLKSLWRENHIEIRQHTRTIVSQLFSKNEREFHYCAMEIMMTELKNKYVKEDIHLIKKLLTTHAWWDSVDIISKHILGNYLLQFPEYIEDVVTEFNNESDIWLNRSTILFQLGYKSKTDFALLMQVCLLHKDSNEFFIQKAIGWALREYAKSNPEAVKDFIFVNNLKPLSRKEALKNLSVA
ncbi:DNA alkylation repair protein [Flavobacterium faecale]|uniref:DNA alkylation repair protein n=1 Tax=Flavobacterium faecale TaxID=1355330 RepID=UPI003AAC6101